ncbi:MAG TPA: papain-like cysteine protease family protein [Candidatus Baltobacteraceae bacterium]|jgi:hypothetical protein|nr:papain-like cysteine protease family protein [Candidatus Baltobacteraceae bacterium]
MAYKRAHQLLRVFLSALFGAAVGLTLGSGTVQAQSNPGATLAVPLYGQQTNVWCWDASSLMVIKYFRPWSTLTQCAIATQATSGQNCCTSPVPTPCVHTGWEMLSSNGFNFNTASTALSFATLNSEISAKRPVLYAIGWTGGGGHMLVADGWFILNGVEYVSVNDPWPPTSGTQEQQTYDYWVGGPYYDHVTWADFYDIVDTVPTPSPHPTIRFHTPFPRFSIRPYFEIPSIQLPLGPDPLKKPNVVLPEVTQHATDTITQLHSASSEVIRRLGFASSDEVSAARLGTPLQEYIVPADKLAAYTAKNSPSSLLTGGTTLFYPVVVAGEVRSSVRVLTRPGAPSQVISLGDTGTAAHLQQLEGINTLVGKRSDVSIPAVRIPALGLYFVGRTTAGKLQIASIFDVPWLGLKKGQFTDAQSVFLRLAPFASKVKGTM